MSQNNWRPSASIEMLRLRASVLVKIRSFFSFLGVMEVETPLLSLYTVTDPNLHSFSAQSAFTCGNANKTLYLQTSPEYAMKRLLAAGSGPIFQICKAFRDEEYGALHNPEFTMLEWYRVEFDHNDLMDEMDDFLAFVLNSKRAKRLSYKSVFEMYLDIDPFGASIDDLSRCAQINGIDVNCAFSIQDRDIWLNLLFSHIIEPKLGYESPTFIHDFPASQAALARLCQNNPLVSERFEVYVNGIELANGFHELQDSKQQLERFSNDLLKRKRLGLCDLSIDGNLLSALEHGLPNCAGVALGLDRLLMIAAGSKSIKEVISFGEF